jgi:hypothetical protein
LAQKMQVGPCIPARIQRQKAEVGPTSGPTRRLSRSCTSKRGARACVVFLGRHAIRDAPRPSPSPLTHRAEQLPGVDLEDQAELVHHLRSVKPAGSAQNVGRL